MSLKVFRGIINVQQVHRFTACLNLNQVAVDLALKLELGNVLIQKPEKLATCLVLLHLFLALFVDLNLRVIKNICQL
jgi:hypothetical protein